MAAYWMYVTTMYWQFWLNMLGTPVPTRNARVYDLAKEREKRRMIV